MPPAPHLNSYRWLHSGAEAFPALLSAIDSAQKTIRLEVYTFANDDLGKRFRDALVKARQRGVQVQVLLDAFGSLGLTTGFWQPLLAAGGQVRWFNPVLLNRLGYRDHRKLLVCDERTAIVGGFNITRQYEGDGVASGWYDLGLEIVSPLAVQLASAFDEMFARSAPDLGDSGRISASPARRSVTTDEGDLLLSGPGRGQNPFKRALRRDLARARNVEIIAAYFLPTGRIRRALLRVVKRGGRVRLILPGKSDVLLSQLAGRSLYRRLLKAGVEIHEYQPQILHAKLLVIDDIVYAGSANLDPRSLQINYELMLRFENEPLVSGARRLFAHNLRACEPIELEKWRKSRTWLRRLKQRWAYFLLARLDPLLVRWQHRRRPR